MACGSVAPFEPAATVVDAGMTMVILEPPVGVTVPIALTAHGSTIQSVPGPIIGCSNPTSWNFLPVDELLSTSFCWSDPLHKRTDDTAAF